MGRAMWWAALVAFAAAMAALPVASRPARAEEPRTQDPRAQDPQVTEFKLANGLEVIVIPDHRTPVVTHMIYYKAGSADEPPGKSGIAHFLEHLMFKGTAKNPARSACALPLEMKSISGPMLHALALHLVCSFSCSRYQLGQLPR
jgi:predicted Zn-dependent peptidase